MKRTTWLAALVAFLAVAVLFQDAFGRSRMYHPSLGRFMQRDILGYVDGMSLYQYAGSNPIVATDPMGGCSKSDEEKALACKCFCITKMTASAEDINEKKIKGDSKVRTGGILTIGITGVWKDVPTGVKGGKPTLEWWEHYSMKPKDYDKKLVPGQWWDMYKEKPSNGVFKQFNEATTETTQITLQDNPGISHEPVSPSYTQEAYWAIRVSSTPGCPCRWGSMTAYAEHNYQTSRHKMLSNHLQIVDKLPYDDPTAAGNKGGIKEGNITMVPGTEK